MSTKEQDPVSIEEAAQPKERNVWTRICHSFHRRDAGRDCALGEADHVREAGDLTRLNRKLKTRHLQMIAIGGSIGCGFFIGSGAALKDGGPGAVILDFCIIGLMMYCTIHAMGELATLFPVQGYPHDGRAYNRFYCCLLHSVYRSRMGFCNGLELCYLLACYISVRIVVWCLRHELLGATRNGSPLRMDFDILRPHYRNQHVWCPRLRRGRIHIFMR